MSAEEFNAGHERDRLRSMWITPPSYSDSSGLLRRLYDAAIKRAGRVYAIVRSMGLNPPVLRSSIGLYRDIMMGDSPLSRAQRELLATAVSRFNDCEY